MIEGPSWYPTLTADERERLRARLNLRAVLPLLPIMVAEHPPTARRLGALTSIVRLDIRDRDIGATLRFRTGRLTVHPGPRLSEPVDVHCQFASVRALNRFFAGRPTLPRIFGWRHPIVLAQTARLLLGLRLLQPDSAPAAPAERRLRARLLLALIVHGLAELYRGGHPDMVALVRASPDRVYQWSVGDGALGAYVRMRAGRLLIGDGPCRARRPFVRYHFRDVDALLQVLGETESQMTGLRGGLFRTEGSPEYTRKIAMLMQYIDSLLMAG